jgi:hypothetical protein
MEETGTVESGGEGEAGSTRQMSRSLVYLRRCQVSDDDPGSLHYEPGIGLTLFKVRLVTKAWIEMESTEGSLHCGRQGFLYLLCQLSIIRNETMKQWSS